MSQSPSVPTSRVTVTLPPDETGGASLVLGRTADGRPLSLDLGSGTIREMGPPDPQLQLLSPHDLDTTRVMGAFRSAGYDVALDGDGDLIVRDGQRVGVVMSCPALLVVRMLMLYDFQAPVLTPTRRAAVAALNRQMYHGRFLVTPDGRLAATQELTTSAGLSTAQLLATYRLFAGCVREAIEGTRVGRLLE